MTAKIGLSERRLLAGEVAKELGVGVQTLHFYEQQGLIPHPPRSESGYRLYTPDIIERIRFIRKAQALGFSLDEIKEIFGLAKKGTSPCGPVQRALSEKLRDVDRRLEELRGFRADLAALIAEAPELSAHEQNAQVCSIVEEAAPLPTNPISKPALIRKAAQKRASLRTSNRITGRSRRPH
ncbi:MAG: heavy metal-responsive transcriptional regulator [Pyrinomonadaceae bacterium]|nr:heavy metal-responsive transcriptional regulator [Pyrinomonadaceae bacterium]